MQSRNDVIFVTGADAKFARNLHQLFLAVERHGWNQGTHWIAYDLGMDATQSAHLAQRFPWVEQRPLDLTKLPSHYLPSFGAYAWKAHIFWQVVEQATGPVFWMDSANLPRGDMQPMLDWVRAHGLYMLHGQTPLIGRCDRRMLARLGVPPWIWGSRELASGLVGIDAARPELRKIIQDWATLSDDPDIIRPPQDTFVGHRNDQSVLNALVQPLAATGKLTLPNHDIDISAANPINFISTRNKLDRNFPHWADAIGRLKYAVIKAVDKAAIRANKMINRRWFLSRWRGEYFEVRIKRRDQKDFDVIPCPLGHYYADPFLWEKDGAPWLLFEDFYYPAMRGTISAMPLDGSGKAVPAFDPGVHASFPFLFQHDDKLWMVPETFQNDRLDLYECTDFPSGWRLHRSILQDVHAVDTVVFEHADRWWLITSMKSPQPGGPQYYLAVFHSNDPVDGDWLPHPVNLEGREITAAHGTGRNAGGVFMHNGDLIRCVQSSSEYYGQGMEYRRISRLTPQEYHEEPIAPPPHLAMTQDEGVHHVSQRGDLIVWDKRMRH